MHGYYDNPVTMVTVLGGVAGRGQLEELNLTTVTCTMR